MNLSNDGSAFLEHPLQASQKLQLCAHARVNLGEMNHIQAGVAPLGFREGPLQPIRTRFLLVHLDAEHVLYKLAIADTEAFTKKCCPQLRVEDPGNTRTEPMGEHLDILAARVEDLFDVLVIQQRAQRGRVANLQRVNEPDLVPRRQLNERYARKVGVGSLEFRIDDYGARRTSKPARLF